ncbi:MAG: hypothetical protein JJU23_15705, partial [Cyclobacteriaceae bacterium]|nr:hypothetical protein [Cyclobacteriaceae bacterium]
FHARQYAPALGRFWSVDPEAARMPSWSPYTFVFNNPLNFIDPDGRIPYPITIRSFAPFKTFGFGFHGDNRGYSNSRSYPNDKGPTARVHQVINFDTDKSKISAKAWSSSTSHMLKSGSPKAKPSINFVDTPKMFSKGDSKTFVFGTHSAGANPMTPEGSPNIDVFSEFSITENKNAGTLDISGKLTGDNFPSTEAFITDPSGQNLFIGISQIGEGVGRNMGPFTELPGENQRPITDFNFSITTDADGNFTGVRRGDETFSIQNWNKQFTTQPTQRE